MNFNCTLDYLKQTHTTLNSIYNYELKLQPRSKKELAWNKLNQVYLNNSNCKKENAHKHNLNTISAYDKKENEQTKWKIK